MTDIAATLNSAIQSTRRLDVADAVDARRVVAVALAAALPLELLLRATPWGINVPLAALGVAIALIVATPRDSAVRAARVVLMAVFVALAVIVAMRAPSMLYLAVVAAMIATVTLAVLPDASWLRSTDPIDLLARAATVLVRSAAGPFWLLNRAVDWNAVLPEDRALLRHARGVAWSLPVVLPFLLLFASADPAFEAITRDFVDLPQLISHVALWSVLAWLGLGWLGVAVFPSAAPAELRVRMGGAEARWVLSLLSLLFAAFVAVQFRYFFGGAELVRSVTGLTYAEYARRGFFELVTVAGLLLVVLLVVDWLTRLEPARSRRVLRVLACVLIALLGVILVSAMQRMRLYIAEYGFTEDRFFTTAFMLWLVVVFAWFGATVLRERRGAFLGGVYATGIAAVFVLAAIDPIGRIAAHNVEHGQRTGRYDAMHLTSLGADAVPVVVAALPALPHDQRCVAQARLIGWLGDDTSWPARSWNRSRERARTLIEPLKASPLECPVEPAPAARPGAGATT